MANLHESYINDELFRLEGYVKALNQELNDDSGRLGVKYDKDKPKWNLLPWDEVEDVVKVLTFGAKKYAPDNWKFVDDANNRYMDAAMRHLVAHQQGESRDYESNESHIAHAICCLLFMLWHDKNDDAS
jgi:hypothetical protein